MGFMKQRALQGVNLGGWLVIEKWITPSLFNDTNATNEFELAATKQGRERIKHHHTMFITEKDLRWLSEQGIEILRVPIGYWIFGDDKRYEPAVDRLDWLVKTSLSLGLKLLLDLHAAPEAQNRAAHSGSGNRVSNEHSTKWLNDVSAQERTIEVLTTIARRYYDSPNIWGIELLNEPSVDFLGLKLARFYRRAYKKLTKVARPGTHIVFSDGYAPLRLTNSLGLLSKPNFPAVLDCHVYQVFGPRNKNRNQRSQLAQLKWTGRLLRFLRLQQPLIVGEWSAMVQRKAPKAEIDNYTKAQRAEFDSTLAHFYWTYKTEDPGRWNFRDLVDRGIIRSQ